MLPRSDTRDAAFTIGPDTLGRLVRRLLDSLRRKA